MQNENELRTCQFKIKNIIADLKNSIEDYVKIKKRQAQIFTIAKIPKKQVIFENYHKNEPVNPAIDVSFQNTFSPEFKKFPLSNKQSINENCYTQKSQPILDSEKNQQKKLLDGLEYLTFDDDSSNIDMNENYNFNIFESFHLDLSPISNTATEFSKNQEDYDRTSNTSKIEEKTDDVDFLETFESFLKYANNLFPDLKKYSLKVINMKKDGRGNYNMKCSKTKIEIVEYVSFC